MIVELSMKLTFATRNMNLLLSAIQEPMKVVNKVLLDAYKSNKCRVQLFKIFSKVYFQDYYFELIVADNGCKEETINAIDYPEFVHTRGVYLFMASNGRVR